VVGADLSEKFLDKNYCQDDLELVAADAGALPFPDRSFDAVASYCFLEHVPDAPKVLAEMARVLRPGGVVLVLSPNLVSPFLVLKSLVNLLRGRVISGVIAPTIFGHLSALVRFIVISIRKGKSGDPMFLYRVPDLEHPSLADADSVYLCNQLDLIRYYSKAGLRSVNAGEGYSSIGKVIAKLFPNCSGECCVVATRLA
jgi:SAM-dependent methyltransferase